MKYKKLKEALEEIFEGDLNWVTRLIGYIEHSYEIWRKYDKPKK